MSWITVIFSMVAAACGTLGFVQLLVWWQNRAKRDVLAFSVLALSASALALCELGMMEAKTPTVFITLLRWMHLPAWVAFLAITSLVLLHLRAGRVWLAWVAVAVRTLALAVNFLMPLNLNFREITHLEFIPFFGEKVAVAVGTVNPWMLLGQLGLLLLIVFVTDAAITVWRRGRRLQALVTGGSIVIFVLASTVVAALSLCRIVDWPLTCSPFFLGLLAVMAFELSRESLRTVTLAAELKDTRDHMRLEVAHLGRVTTLGEISGSLAHELNQPLGAILANAEAAELHLQNEFPDLVELRAILADIRRDDLRAGEIIHGIRDFLRRRSLEMKSIALDGLAAEVVRLVSADAATRRISIGLEIPPAIPKVMGDRVHLQQVLVNLLVNGMDAMSTRAAPYRRIILRATQSAPDSVEIAVSDAGVGVSPASLARVFDPFHTSKPGGLGLGLAICRSIIEAHGGTISLENNPDHGATSRVTLKISREPAAP